MPYTSTAESIYTLVEKGKSGLKATNLHSRRMSDSIWILTNEDIIICNFWISGKRLLVFVVPATLVVLGPSYMVLGTWDNPPPETTYVCERLYVKIVSLQAESKLTLHDYS